MIRAARLAGVRVPRHRLVAGPQAAEQVAGQPAQAAEQAVGQTAQAAEHTVDQTAAQRPNGTATPTAPGHRCRVTTTRPLEWPGALQPRAVPPPMTALSGAILSHRVRVWVALVLAAVLAGSIGYVVIEGWSALDAVYMTVITMTTVGFKEVRELDTAGRL